MYLEEDEAGDGQDGHKLLRLEVLLIVPLVDDNRQDCDVAEVAEHRVAQ